MELNITGYNAISMISPSWTAILVSVGVFVGVFTVIFLISKNFRQLIYGSVISTILLLNYKFSTYVGASTAQGDYKIVKWCVYVLLFVVVSILLGKAAQKLKFVQEIERSIK